MRKSFAIAFCLIFLCGAKIQNKPDGIYVSEITTKELVELYKKHDYTDYLYVKDWKYPRIFLQKMPSDFDKIDDEKERTRLFLMIMAPLAMKLNLEILSEREEFLKINRIFKKNRELTKPQEAFLEEKAKKYDVFTRLKGYRRYEYIAEELNKKIDDLPPSLLVGAAAIESNWGASRAIMKANSPYKELTWYGAEKGLDPIGETEDKSYKIKLFPSLYAAMQSYALKLNSHRNYFQSRILRSEIKYRNKPVFGKSLANSMIFDSNLENFAGLLEYTLVFYKLDIFDEASLEIVTKN